MKPRSMTADQFNKWCKRVGLHRTVDVAAALGVDPVTVWRWQNGERKVPPHLCLACAYIEHEPALDELGR